MSDNEVNDFLFGGEGRSFQFDAIGDTVSGVVTSVVPAQQTDLGTGEPLTWSDGRKRMQLVIQLQTDERNGDDDGIRTIYAKGGRYEIAQGEGQSMRDAIAEAITDAGGKGLVVGDKLAVCFTGLSKPTQRGYQPAKLYVAGWEPAPPQQVSLEELTGETAPVKRDLFGKPAATDEPF